MPEYFALGFENLLQDLKDTDKSAREIFCTQMQVMLEEDGFDDRLVFSDEATSTLLAKSRNTTHAYGS